MDILYRCLLRLYPASYQAAFADEMLTVYREAVTDATRRGGSARARFFMREIAGLLRGAVREWLTCDPASGFVLVLGRSFMIRPQFRFSTTGICFMVVSLGLAVAAIGKGSEIARADYPWFSLLRPIAVCFAIAVVAGLCGWGVVFATRRSGSHRLSQIETWQPRP
jgi:hypothetical protein